MAKHSIYMNNYETMNSYSKGLTIEDAKNKYIEYLDTVMRDIQNLIKLVKEDQLDIKNFMYYQQFMIEIRNSMNAESLSAFHMSYAEEMERIVRSYEYNKT